MQIAFSPVRTQDDIDRLAAMAGTVWHEFFPALLSPEQIDYMVERFQSPQALGEQTARQGYEYFFIEADDRPVGYTGIRAEGGKLFLSKLYLLREARGHGYAGRAFDFLEGLARARGLSAVWLTVNRFNTHAIEVYKARGFRILRTQAADIGGGFIMDDYIMEKSL